MSPPLDYVVVGAGMFGAVFARCAADAGRRVLVVNGALTAAFGVMMVLLPWAGLLALDLLVGASSLWQKFSQPLVHSSHSPQEST